MTTKTSTIISGSIDLATLVLWPYAVGFLTVMVYYSQYKLFHFNPISAQYVLVGAYVLALYFVTPYLLLRLFHRSSPRWSLPLKLLALLTIDVLICKVFIDMMWSAVLLFVATLFILQLGFLINQHGFFDLRFLKTPVKTAVFAVLAAFHFAWLFFPYLPYFYGGGEPTEVYVFPAKDYEGMIATSDNSYAKNLKLNWPAFRMCLLLETDEEYVFLRTLKKKLLMPGTPEKSKTEVNIVRISKQAIMRLEYRNNTWFNLREGVVREPKIACPNPP